MLPACHAAQRDSLYRLDRGVGKADANGIEIHLEHVLETAEQKPFAPVREQVLATLALVSDENPAFAE